MKQDLNRRQFLQASGALALSSSALGKLRLSAPKPPAGKTMVVLFLRGGADNLNMLVPYKDKDYHQARPTIAIQEDDGLVPLDDGFALHPGLAPLAPYYESKQFAPVLNVGSPHFTRSHFDAQDFMERAAPGLRNITSGWLNRYLAHTASADASEFRALAMQNLLPRSLRGDYPVLAVPSGLDRRRSGALDRFDEFYGEGEMAGEPSSAGQADSMEPQAETDEVVYSGQKTIQTLRRFQKIIAQGKNRVKDGTYPSSSFGRALSALGKVIHAGEGLEIAAVDYHGWDHHANQGGIQGRHTEMVTDYGQAVAAFCRDLGPRLNDVLILTMTEFGRTVRENGNTGTDHGRGGAMFLIGGGVRGGQIHGNWKGLKESILADGRDLPVLTDFRDVFSASLKQLFDFRAPKGFFPQYKPKKLRLW